ncbi:MAG: ATP-binding protein, partial [Alphaproteobacteria bacterium]
ASGEPSRPSRIIGGGPAANPEGFGLGLAIVSRLAHALNVKVQVRSRVGLGSTFRLTFRDLTPR